MTLPVVHRFRDAEALADGGAELVAARLGDAIARRGQASIVLAGGSTPRLLYQRLIAHPIDWASVHIYFGDERCVPPTDPASNYRMACEALVDHLPMPPAQLVRIAGELGPAEAAARYAAIVAAAPRLDLVLLGMGDDGHVASLFPDTAEPEDDTIAIATRSPIAPHQRVSLTLRAIAAARTVVLLVSGAAKAARLAAVHAELRAGRPVLPAARIGPAIWLVDEAAAQAITAAVETSR